MQSFRGRRILLVEDNLLNSEVASALLGDMGAWVDTSCNGQEGVEAFNHSGEYAYDLILMDIQMPLMDGYTAAREIRRLNRKDAKTVPIVAMTADAFAEDIKLAKDAGMNTHIAKPIDAEILYKTIKKIFDKQ